MAILHNLGNKEPEGKLKEDNNNCGPTADPLFTILMAVLAILFLSL